jgi:hypothetical protein
MTVRIIRVLAVAIMIGPSLAHGSPACMTISEARAKFPKETLYSHRHCWNLSSAAVPVHSLLQPAPVPASRSKVVSSGTDAGAQCQYSPCE